VRDSPANSACRLARSARRCDSARRCAWTARAAATRSGRRADTSAREARRHAIRLNRRPFVA